MWKKHRKKLQIQNKTCYPIVTLSRWCCFHLRRLVDHTSCSSASVGFCPREHITIPSSLVVVQHVETTIKRAIHFRSLRSLSHLITQTHWRLDQIKIQRPKCTKRKKIIQIQANKSTKQNNSHWRKKQKSIRIGRIKRLSTQRHIFLVLSCIIDRSKRDLENVKFHQRNWER